MRRSLAGISAALVVAQLAYAQTTARVSIDSSGAQANEASSTASMSGDGRYVAFASRASNLTASDTNNVEDAFVHDRVTGVTVLASVSTGGTQANRASFEPEITFDGRFLTFHSAANDLVAGDLNGKTDVFFRNGLFGGGATLLWSSDYVPSGVQGNGDSTRALALLGYGGGAFQSSASNLVASDTNGVQDVFFVPSSGGAVTRVSVGVGGAEANQPCELEALLGSTPSAIFSSSASNLVAGDTNGVTDIFAPYPAGHPLVRISVDSTGAQANGPSHSASIDGLARRVAFASRASNLVAGDTNGVEDVFLRDLVTSVTTRVSIDSTGAQANGASSRPSIAADGTFVAFYSEASNLVAGDTNGRGDVFVRDLTTGTTTCESRSSSGALGDGDSGALSVRISGDGRFIAFDSLSTNLVAGDTNGFRDIFVRDRGEYPGTYCTGGTSTNGCVATIYASGTPSASNASPFTIRVASVEGQKSGIVFYGITGQIALPWQAGSSSYLCVKQPTQRTQSQSSNYISGTCLGMLTLDWNAYVATHPGALGQPFAAGQHVFVQAWYRDPPAPKTTNLSNALEFVVLP